MPSRSARIAGAATDDPPEPPTGSVTVAIEHRHDILALTGIPSVLNMI